MRMMSARVQLATLFYSFKHPKYQQLYLRDLCERVRMPNSIKSHVEGHERFSVSNCSNRGQGGDFIQEEANKSIKSFLLPGMPSSEIWKRFCRKAATLKELKELVCDKTAGKKIRYKRHLHEVRMMRREIRVQNFASQISYEQNNLISLDGLPLDSDLANLKYTAVENYDHYKEQYGLNSLFGCNIKTPIFVTPREREEKNEI